MGRRLLFLCGTRDAWHRIRPILRRAAVRDDVECRLVVPELPGRPSARSATVREIERDGFTVDHLRPLADVVAGLRPDWIVLAGDCPEPPAQAIAQDAGAIPVARVHAPGDAAAGPVDLHLVSEREAAQRLLRAGVAPARVRVVGTPQLDEIAEQRHTHADVVASRYGLVPGTPLLLVVLHAAAGELDHTGSGLTATMTALRHFDLPIVVVLPDDDAAAAVVGAGLEAHRHGDLRVFARLPRADFLGLLARAACIVGNAGCALVEAPMFGLPAVNLGGRQDGRARGRNVIDAPFDGDAIHDALNRALDPTFRALLRRDGTSPYGDGHSADRILDLLCGTPLADASSTGADRAP